MPILLMVQHWHLVGSQSNEKPIAKEKSKKSPRTKGGNPKPVSHTKHMSQNEDRPGMLQARPQPGRPAKPPSPCKHCGGNHWHSECPKMGGNLYQASDMSSDFMKDVVLANIGGNVAEDGTFYYDSEQMATDEVHSP